MRQAIIWAGDGQDLLRIYASLRLDELMCSNKLQSFKT